MVFLLFQKLQFAGRFDFFAIRAGGQLSVGFGVTW
jgi:hypothetical protein